MSAREYQIQTVDTESPVLAERWQTISEADTAEDAYDLYIATFQQRRADGIKGRVQVLRFGKPVSLVPAPKRGRR